jgi:lysozyme
MMNEYYEMTKSFEGYRSKPYKCSAGKLTIGYGRNLEDCGITEDEANYLFENDFNKAIEDAKRLCKEYDIDFEHLSEGRKYVLTDMVFNMGYSRTSKFKKMLTALKNGLYDDAATEMLDSAWAKQVGNRATKLSEIMKKSS